MVHGLTSVAGRRFTRKHEIQNSSGLLNFRGREAEGVGKKNDSECVVRSRNGGDVVTGGKVNYACATLK